MWYCSETSVGWNGDSLDLNSFQLISECVECCHRKLRYNMRGRFKRKETYWKPEVGQPTAVEVISPAELSPLLGESTSSEGPDSPVSEIADMGLDNCHKKSKFAMMSPYQNIRLMNVHRHAEWVGWVVACCFTTYMLLYSLLFEMIIYWSNKK